MATPDFAAVQHYRSLAELISSHWQSGSVTAEDGTQIHYTRTGGNNPPILLLHGVQVDGLSWLRTAQALESTYDVIMPDFRGHGQTAGLEHGVTADLLVNDMIAVIRALGLEKPCVVGHSMGADIAGRLAAVHPLRAVVLVDPALRNFAGAIAMDSDTPPPWMQSLFDTLQALKTQSHAERMASGLRLLPPGTPLWDEADYVTFIEGQTKFDVRFFRDAMRMGYLFEMPDVIAQIACPMLLMTARPMMPGATLEPGLSALMSNWRNGQHVHFDDSGHAIHFDQFNRFVEVLTQFLQQH